MDSILEIGLAAHLSPSIPCAVFSVEITGGGLLVSLERSELEDVRQKVNSFFIELLELLVVVLLDILVSSGLERPWNSHM